MSAAEAVSIVPVVGLNQRFPTGELGAAILTPLEHLHKLRKLLWRWRGGACTKLLSDIHALLWIL
jgi:hypothetical protein